MGGIAPAELTVGVHLLTVDTHDREGKPVCTEALCLYGRAIVGC